MGSPIRIKATADFSGGSRRGRLGVGRFPVRVEAASDLRGRDEGGVEQVDQ
jgi:hypothetical protein